MLRKCFRTTLLAWRQLVKEKTRLAIAVVGIAFANILICAQMGFEASLFDSSTAPQRGLDADLVVVSSHFKSVYSVKNFSRERLYQALGFAEVESVSPLYMGYGKWRNPQTRRIQSILVFGTDPRTTAFKFPEVHQNRSQLQKLNTVLFDQASIPEFGPIATLFQQQSTVETELNDVSIRVVGLFILGASFGAYGNAITSDSTFLHLFPDHHPNQIQIGLIQLKPGADAQQIAKILTDDLPDDVMILTKEDFARVEKAYWAKTTPIGFIFGLGVIVSFIVGIAIVYQIIYADVADHLPQYSMLKAIGYSDRYLIVVLIQEALLLAVLGYIPGFIVSLGLYQLAAAATMLPMFMTIERSVTVFVLTVAMCLISTASTMRKLNSADPADVF
ncbi:MAG: FtsX-like permease family protein [Fischerella sp.]|jgi:putative ABC transport system permease protein|uniref:ABC transporter permease DevC n=1 Tax=Fischerella sp. TaxID=1191 RepID=UPI0017B625CB|nr:ABC transporter permease DevC [Fischerella sp.]NWF59657.1 FtsX-like permease family protein [Fischerella sp.]